MNLKILFMILVYYSIIGLVLAFGVSSFGDVESNIDLNSSELTDPEVDTGGLFGTGVSFGRFVSLISIGIGLPADTPIWFTILFSAWQTLVLIFTIGFFISSIWNG